MKYSLLPIAALVLILLASVACRTTSTVTTNPDGSLSTNTVRAVDVPQLALGLKTLAQSATVYGTTGDRLAKHPEIKTDLTAAVSAIDLLLAKNSYDLTSIQLALNQVTAKESASTAQEIQLGAATVIALYQSNYSMAVSDKINGNANARVILLALRNGIAAGIGLPQVQ